MIVSTKKSILKMVKSLGDTKGRRLHGCFKAEGTKSVLDTLGHFELEGVYADAGWAAQHPDVKDTTVSRRADL